MSIERTLDDISHKLNDALRIPTCPYCLSRIEGKLDALLHAVQALKDKIDTLTLTDAKVADLEQKLQAATDSLKQSVESQPK